MILLACAVTFDGNLSLQDVFVFVFPGQQKKTIKDITNLNKARKCEDHLETQEMAIPIGSSSSLVSGSWVI